MYTTEGRQRAELEAAWTTAFELDETSKIQETCRAAKQQARAKFFCETLERIVTRIQHLRMKRANVQVMKMIPFLVKHGVSYERGSFDANVKKGVYSIDTATKWIGKAIKMGVDEGFVDIEEIVDGMSVPFQVVHRLAYCLIIFAKDAPTAKSLPDTVKLDLRFLKEFHTFFSKLKMAMLACIMDNDGGALGVVTASNNNNTARLLDEKLASHNVSESDRMSVSLALQSIEKPECRAARKLYTLCLIKLWLSADALEIHDGGRIHELKLDSYFLGFLRQDVLKDMVARIKKFQKIVSTNFAVHTIAYNHMIAEAAGDIIIQGVGEKMKSSLEVKMRGRRKRKKEGTAGEEEEEEMPPPAAGCKRAREGKDDDETLF
eukprot:1190948-Rhodomonas_salina.1